MLGVWGLLWLRVLWPAQEALARAVEMLGRFTNWLGYTEFVDEEHAS